ncbi:protein of unknown function (plasmid) [Streptococcus thermophilus]|nr:protein of unknown function [Streptococcus thermophilus]
MRCKKIRISPFVYLYFSPSTHKIITRNLSEMKRVFFCPKNQ